MEALSQKKKIGIIAGAILLLTVVALVSTGRMSLTGLSSSAISSSTYVCNEQNQARNLAQYNQIPNNIINANNKISIISGEIKVLQDKINAHNTTIAQKQAQITTRPAEIVRLNGLIVPLTTFINTKCSKPTGSMVRTCNDKKKEKLKYENEITKLNNLENDITKLQNEIGTPENSKSLKGKIQLKENQIGIWRGKIAGYELSKKQYERCALELKTKPTVFSAAMSGEIKLISGEIQPGTEKLVSGEIMFFTGTVAAPLVSGEVTISGEVGQPTLLTVVTNKMEFSVKPTPENNFNIKDWFLEFDQYARTACTSKQVSPSPVEFKVICNLPAKNTPPVIISAGTIGSFRLIGKLGSITMPLAVETNFVSLQYNGSRTDIDKQTAPSNLRYEKSPVADVYFRFASWTCHNGEQQNEGGTSSCKPQSLWKQYAETFCQNKCSPETGKCGVNSYSNSEQCNNSPYVCGNGIKEGAEQCDDGNTNDADSCNNLCQTGTTGGGGSYTVSCASISEAAGNSCNNCRHVTLNSTHMPVNIFTPRTGIQSGSYEFIYTAQSSITGTAYQSTNVTPTGNITNLFNLTERGVGNNSWVWATMKSGNSITKGPIPGNINIDRPIYLLKFSTVSAFKNADNVVQSGTDVTKNDCFFYYEPQATTPSCTDTDGGLNYAVKGSAQQTPSSSSSTFIGVDDHCIMNTTNNTPTGELVEGFCDPNNKVSTRNFICPNGCNNGACITNAQLQLTNFSISAPSEVIVNETFDISIKAERAGNMIFDKYEGTVLFQTVADSANFTFPKLSNGDYGYKFTLADQGVHTFAKGFTFKKAGNYEIDFLDLNVPPAGIIKTIKIKVIDKPTGPSCNDTDNGIFENVVGTVSGISYYGEPYTYTDVCNKDADGKEWVSEAFCYAYPEGGAKVFWAGQRKDCPNGCSDGACKTADPVVEVCEDLAVTPSMTQGGGTITYTCQGNTDILCVLDPQYCKPKTYSVIIKKPDGTVLQTYTTATGSITIPSSPTGAYTAECFVNGQTTTIDACKKTITNQAPVVACTGTLPTNATILNNVGNTSRAWTYDGSPTGPYQNCSFKCPTGTTYSNNACNAPTGNLLVSLSSATPLTGYAAGGSTVVAAVFDFKSENVQHTIKQLKFKVGSSEATSAINAIQLYDGSNTIGSPSVFIGNNATIDAPNLVIPANTTKTIIVRLTLNTIGAGAGLSQSNVGLTLDEVNYENSTNGLRTTNSTDIVANAKYVYQSFPVLTQIAVNTSTKITNGTARDILKFSITAPITATTSNGISVKQVRFPISWIDGGGSSDTLEVESLKLSIDGTDITGTDISIQDQGGASIESTSGLTESDNYIIITWDSNKELTIGAGQVRTLTLRGTMQGFNMGDQETSPADYFTIGFEPDYEHNDTKRYLVNHAPTDNIINLSATPDGSSGSVRYSFLWSDNSSSVHTGAVNTSSSNDWANSYPMLSPLSNQVFTNSNI